MPSGSPEQRGLVAVLLALGLRRNAAVGAGVGLVVAAAAYLYRVVYVGGSLGVPTSAGLFLLLAFVLAATLAALVTVVLTLVAAIRAARDLDAGAT